MAKKLDESPDFLKGGKSYTLEGQGRRIVLYPIGTLAYECGKSAVTLRKWENMGILPDAPFRGGSNQRLYSKEHIALIKKLVVDENLTTGVHFRKTNFSKRVTEGFKKLTVDKLETLEG